jgi:hypothetical protein
MIVHCETCKIDLLETKSDQKALNMKDLHEFESGFEDQGMPKHPVNVYIEHRGRRIRIAGMYGPFDVDI